MSDDSPTTAQRRDDRETAEIIRLRAELSASRERERATAARAARLTEAGNEVVRELRRALDDAIRDADLDLAIIAWREAVRGDAPAATTETNAELAAAIDWMRSDRRRKLVSLVSGPDGDKTERAVATIVRAALDRAAAAPTDGQATEVWSGNPARNVTTHTPAGVSVPQKSTQTPAAPTDGQAREVDHAHNSSYRGTNGQAPADEPPPPSPDPRGDGLCPNCPTDLAVLDSGHGVCIECGWTSDPGKCFELYNRIDELENELHDLRAAPADDTAAPTARQLTADDVASAIGEWNTTPGDLPRDAFLADRLNAAAARPARDTEEST